jgi:hypothetical protein
MSTADPDSDARVDLAHFDELYSTKDRGAARGA